jgi:hypothetical protein
LQCLKDFVIVDGGFLKNISLFHLNEIDNNQQSTSSKWAFIESCGSFHDENSSSK